MCVANKTAQYNDKKGTKMNTREHMQTVTVTTQSTEVQQSFTLEYYILSGDARTDGTAGHTYGIEVLKKSKTEFGTIRVEYRKIFDIFCTRQEAANAALLLARNTVTPISIHDVIEQLIGTNEIENEVYEIAAIS